MAAAEQIKFYEMLGKRIREARLKANFKQEAFASYLNLSRASIVNIEKGRQHPSIYLLWVIAKVLDIDVIDLLPDFTVAQKFDATWENLINTKTKGDRNIKEKISSFIEKVKISNQKQS